MSELADYCRETAERARRAARDLAVVKGQVKIDWLRRAATAIHAKKAELAAANEKDLAAAPDFGLTDAQVDRLRLTDDRLESIAAALEQVALLPDPVGSVRESTIRPNGLVVNKVGVPLGVVFFIYESRPNVTADAAALCVKSGNAVVLRGGKEAFHSNTALHALLADELEASGLPRDAVQLVSTTDRAAVGEFLGLSDLIDVTIPRGGKGLIERVAAEATMPVIKHFDGICHVYVDRAADLDMAVAIAVNAKCQRTGVCNATETLLVHREVAGTFLPRVAKEYAAAGCELRGCERTREILPDVKPATDEDFHTEYLDLILSVRVVDDLEQAIDHVEQYGSHHTDAILTNDLAASERFTAAVDSAAVMVNASTRFNDGEEFGLGAEIGISTDRFHARGPCGLRELTSYKYVVHGSGQTK